MAVWGTFRRCSVTVANRRLEIAQWVAERVAEKRRRPICVTVGVPASGGSGLLTVHVSLHGLVAVFDSLVPRHTTYTVALPHFGMLCWYCSMDTIYTAPTLLVTSH